MDGRGVGGGGGGVRDVTHLESPYEAPPVPLACEVMGPSCWVVFVLSLPETTLGRASADAL